MKIDFSFSWTGYISKAEQHSLSYLLIIGKKDGFIPFPNDILFLQTFSSIIMDKASNLNKEFFSSLIFLKLIQ